MIFTEGLRVGRLETRLSSVFGRRSSGGGRRRSSLAPVFHSRTGIAWRFILGGREGWLRWSDRFYLSATPNTPLPYPSRSIGIRYLGENRELNYIAQSLAGKILAAKELVPVFAHAVVCSSTPFAGR